MRTLTGPDAPLRSQSRVERVACSANEPVDLSRRVHNPTVRWPTNGLTGLAALLALGTMIAFQTDSDWLNVLAPACIVVGLVSVFLLLRSLTTRRD